MEFIYWIKETFNNREIANGLWLLFIVIISISYSNIRKGFFGVVRAAFVIKLLIPFLLFCLNSAFIVWFLSILNLWALDQLIATILWVLLSGIPLMFKLPEEQDGRDYFKKQIRSSLRVFVIFEFIVVAYSFSLIVEFILVPVFFFIGGLIALAERDEKYYKTKVFLEWILALFVIVFAWYSVSNIISEPANFFTEKTARNFILPIYLAAGAIPFLYCLFCYMRIETAIIQIDQKNYQSDALKAYAKCRFILAFGWRPWLLKRATRQFHILPAEEKEDVKKIISSVLKYEREMKNPPFIDPKKGWSPYTAQAYLANAGFRLNDYHYSGYDEEWFAESNSIALDSSLLPNYAIFYIEGIEGTVKRLKLRGHFDYDDLMEERFMNYVSYVKKLILESEAELPEGIEQALKTSKDFVQSIKGTKYKWMVEDWPSGKGFSIVFTLERGS